jgi:hypothetical protein
MSETAWSPGARASGGSYLISPGTALPEYVCLIAYQRGDQPGLWWCTVMMKPDEYRA